MSSVTLRTNWDVLFTLLPPPLALPPFLLLRLRHSDVGLSKFYGHDKGLRNHDQPVRNGQVELFEVGQACRSAIQGARFALICSRLQIVYRPFDEYLHQLLKVFDPTDKQGFVDEAITAFEDQPQMG